jgi:hypothetical protein
VGTALNTLMSAPYALQLAHGETRLGILLHIGLILLFVPAIIIAASLYGAIGAGWVWIGLNTVYLAIGLPWTHRLLLRGESTIWLIEDVLAPGAAGGVVVAVGWLLCRPSDSPVLAVASALVTLAAGWFAAAMAGARVRRWLLPSAALWRARRANAHS